MWGGNQMNTKLITIRPTEELKIEITCGCEYLLDVQDSYLYIIKRCKKHKGIELEVNEQ